MRPLVVALALVVLTAAAPEAG
jgi:hypothetical protein